MIRMTHPTLGTHVDVPEPAVEAWAAQGWLRPGPAEVQSPSAALERLGKHVPPELATVTIPVTRTRTKRTKTPRDDVR